MEPNKQIVEQPNSVKFSINAKGLYSGECKVYAATSQEALDEATKIAKQMEVIIAEKNARE